MVKDRAYAMDARVVVGRSAEIPAPLHMVISSYPAHYESTTVTKGGVEIFIRPIRPEDAPLLVDLFNDLSPTSIYYRFLSPLKSLSPDMLARFTQVDYDRDIALVAIQKVNGEEKMLAVARLLGDPDGTEAEFAIVVGDPWQGKGVGAALLERCISIAAERGMRSVWGIVLPENTQMLALGRKLGFKITRPPGGSDYELRIDLSQNL
jgi:acetyltransferase